MKGLGLSNLHSKDEDYEGDDLTDLQEVDLSLLLLLLLVLLPPQQVPM